MNTHLDIAVRAYTEKKAQKPPYDPTNDQPSEWSLVFDTETTTDAAQALRVGGYQIRKGDKLHKAGLFFEPNRFTEADVKLLQSYAAEHGLDLMTRWQFVHDVFYKVSYDWVGTVIGFNLPFDLSRLAIAHSAARKTMNGGYSFTLSANRRLPRLRVKALSRRIALIDFASPMGQASARGERRRGLNFEHHKGIFVDVKTIAAALTSRSFTLASLCAHLKTETRKQETDDHGQALTADYLGYLRHDVQATWECFVALRSEYARHRLSRPIHKVLSEASIGKAYLSEMGIKPRLKQQPDFPRDIFGKVMCAYYGGRAEIRLRRTATQVSYCDFKSMYPTVNTLVGLWRYVIADGMVCREATVEVRDFLESVSVADLQEQATWRKLTAIVRLRPDNDLLPVRAKYDGKVHTIGLNYLSCDKPLWYTLADAVAAKVLTGKTPQIEEAIFFEPGAPQQGLKSIDLFGLPEFRIDPYADDGFRKMVELRDQVRDDPDKQTEQQAIKIISNATSYGIFIEVQSDTMPEAEAIRLWGPDGELDVAPSCAIEQPGNFFDAALGALITGAARLMLALAERRAADEGLGWVFCDTDSLAIARPDALSESAFYERADNVVAWFEALNPYEAGGSILQLEKHNFDVVTKERRALFAWAISAKRYALFNDGPDGVPILRKASAHGLGQLRAPYGEADAPSHIPPPVVDVVKIGVDRWQYDLWFNVIQAALSGSPDMVAIEWHSSLGEPAASRYGATTPEMLGWFDPHNAGLAYADQVKPFNFLLSFTGKNGAWGPYRETVLDALPGKGRPKKLYPELKPVSAFEKDVRNAKTFDRETGKAVTRELLMTYAEALSNYHLSPETKFENGREFDFGLTRRRHVKAGKVRLIGKEANKVGNYGEADLVSPAIADFRITELPNY